MDQIQETRERIRKALVNATTQRAEEDLKNYQEPQRAGIRKGEEIGFSKRKRMAAMLMTLHPNALGLKEIGQKVHASNAMLRFWRTEKPFKNLVDAYNDFQGKALSDLLEQQMQEAWDGGDDLNLKLLVNTIPFYSDSIIKRTFATIWSHIDGEKDSSIRLYWIGLWGGVSRAFDVRDEKSVRRFYRDPTTIKYWKAGIETMIDALTKPKITKTLRPKELKEYRETLKRSVFAMVDFLAK